MIARMYEPHLYPIHQNIISQSNESLHLLIIHFAFWDLAIVKLVPFRNVIWRNSGNKKATTELADARNKQDFSRSNQTHT